MDELTHDIVLSTITLLIAMATAIVTTKSVTFGIMFGGTIGILLVGVALMWRDLHR